LFLLFTRQFTFRQALRDYLILFVFTIPMVLYDYYIVSTDKRYTEGIATFLSQPVYTLIPAYGLLLLLAIAGVYFTWKNKFQLNYFPIIWLFSTIIQIYFPIKIIPFQIQLIMGIQVPMAILAIYGLYCLIEKAIGKEVPAAIAVGAFIVVLISSGFTNARTYAEILQEINRQRMPIYLEQPIVDGLNWLNKNAKETDVVISTPIISSYIPVFASTRIYSSDYQAPTPDFPEKEKKINWLFDNAIQKSDSEVAAFLSNNHLAYIFENNYSERVNLPLPPPNLNRFPFLHLDFANNYVRIYSFNPEATAGAHI